MISGPVWRKMVNQTDLQILIRILTLIEAPTNLKGRSDTKGIDGDVDYWFEGGSISLKTGFTEYLFDSGDRATIHVLPNLSIDIVLANQKEIIIREKIVLTELVEKWMNTLEQWQSQKTRFAFNNSYTDVGYSWFYRMRILFFAFGEIASNNKISMVKWPGYQKMYQLIDRFWGWVNLLVLFSKKISSLICEENHPFFIGHNMVTVPWNGKYLEFNDWSQLPE